MMNKVMMILLFTLAITSPVIAGNKGTKSYLQYPSNDKILRPFSLWNPLITIKENGQKSKSFFQYPTDVIKPGIFNPLITVLEKGKKAK